MDARDLRIVFMGTPEFAAQILRLLVEEKFNIVGVVTVPDKPAGRGQKLQESDVKKYSKNQNIPIFQPEKLKNPLFVEEIKKLNADVQVVVAFRMLPEMIWRMPGYGTFNLHASLLPQYRGAAPINWAIINGEKKTGLTTFFIDKEIDTGKIILQKEIEIDFQDTAGILHDKMIPLGAQMIIQTLNGIAEGNLKTISQDMLLHEKIKLKPAPKIYKEDCRINWNAKGIDIYNFIRGLSPFPCSWTEMHKSENERPLILKIFECEWVNKDHKKSNGSLQIENNNIFVSVSGGYIIIKSLQLEGKKRLASEEFLNGFKFDQQFLE